MKSTKGGIFERAADVRERSERKRDVRSLLTVTAYGSWKQETEAYKNRYFALRDEILEQYDELVDQILAEYTIVARGTYRRIQDVSPNVLTESEAAFASSYRERIITLIP